MFKLWVLLTIIVFNDIASASIVDVLQINPPLESEKNIERIAYDCFGECPNDQLRKIFLLANKDQTKYCYCKYGLPYLQKCPSNFVFSLEEGECVDPTKFIKNTNSLTNFVRSLWDKTSSASGTGRSFSSVTLDKENALRCIGECSEDIDQVATLLAHEDCSKYCICKHGNKNVKICHEGLEFDIEEGVCVPLGKSKCKNLKPTQSYACIGSCPLGNFGTLLAHDDCLKYCKCEDGVALIKDCPWDFHFSVEEGICLEPEDAKCNRLNGTLVIPEGCIGTCSSTMDPNKICSLAHVDCDKYCECKNLHVTVKKCNPGYYFNLKSQKCILDVESECKSPQGCDIKCPTVVVDNVTCSGPNADCEKYCLCVDGHPVEKDCPKGLHFSVEEGICVDPKIAGCNTTTPPKPPTPPEGCLSECDSDPDKACIMRHSNCSMWCECYMGELTEHICPDGLDFSLEERECVAPELAGCANETIPSPPKDPCDDHVCNPNGSCKWPTDKCTEFCQCLDGELTHEKCPKGLHYNSNTGMCDRPENANCDNPLPPKPSPPGEGCYDDCPVTDDPDQICLKPNEDCTKYCTCQNGVSTAQDCPEGLHYNEDKMICEDPAIAGCVPYDCIGRCPYDFNNPDAACLLSHADCTKYCHCIDGEPKVEDCIKGLHFSWDLARCDKPKIVKCDRINGTVHSTTSSWKPHGYSEFVNRNIYDKDDFDSENCIGDCPKEDISNVAVVIPHKDYSKYCHCVKGRAYAELCPGDLRFDIKNAKCINL